MIPAEQEFVHDPANGQYGDCQRAVVASLLELDIQAVPHFAQIAKDDPTVFWDSLNDFLESKGLNHTLVSREVAIASGDYHEMAGPSPRGNGVWHAVVGHSGEVFFDPHPTKAGLAGNPDQWYYALYLNDTEDEMQMV